MDCVFTLSDFSIKSSLVGKVLFFVFLLDCVWKEMSWSLTLDLRYFFFCAALQLLDFSYNVNFSNSKIIVLEEYTNVCTSVLLF